ncbi:MAG TPA: hypothetical protein P5509_03545 [Bacteroidales bacterium]|nr:hypothetical protein [Bacteroidales bacterium]
MTDFSFTKNSELIGKYINRHLYTDVNPVGKVIGTRGKTILIIARVTAERDESFKPEIIPGGFAGHCTNNYSQKWKFTVHEDDTFEIRWTPGKLKKGYNRISENPRHFYDYNF